MYLREEIFADFGSKNSENNEMIRISHLFLYGEKYFKPIT